MEDGAGRGMTVMNEQGEVRAAGGVVCRRGPTGGLEVLVVHRPRHSDWSLPKGKVEPGETDETCAVREVEEETGLQCEVESELPSIRYRDRYDRAKVVRYWRMAVDAADGDFEANDEVDQIAWLPIADAVERLSYDRDKEVVLAILDGEAPR